MTAPEHFGNEPGDAALRKSHKGARNDSGTDIKGNGPRRSFAQDGDRQAVTLACDRTKFR